MAEQPSSKPIKTSVYLPQEAVDALKRISKSRGTTMAEVLRRAIATQDYLHQASEKGGEVLIKHGKNVKQLVVI